MTRIRTAIVGCGKVGHIHASALASLPESKFVAVCDRNEDRARAFAGTYGAQACSGLGKMLDQCAVEALMVCTPHPLHAEAVLCAAQHGVHTLVEKPMAASLSDCDQMIEAAERASIKLGVISQRRFYEPVVRMKKAIDAGKIGKPVLGSVIMLSWRDQAYYESDPWRGKWDTEGGGVLVNQSPHLLDILQWLMGPIEEISGYWANLNHPFIEVEDTSVAMLRFRSGGLGWIAVSLCQKPGIYTKIHVHGSNGASVGVQTDTGATFVAGASGVAEPPFNDLWTVPGEESLLEGFVSGDRESIARIDVTTHYHQLQIKDFLRSIAEDRQPIVTGQDGRKVVEIFAGIYESNRTRRPFKNQD